MHGWLPMETGTKASLGCMRPCIKALKSNQESVQLRSAMAGQGPERVSKKKKKALSFFSDFELEQQALFLSRRVNVLL